MFVHLRCHSHYSFLRAVPRPEELIAAATEQARAHDAAANGNGAQSALPESLRGGAVALTDSNGLYAAVPFYIKAREAGVKPILGAVLDVQSEISNFKSRSKGNPELVGADLQIRPHRSGRSPMAGVQWAPSESANRNEDQPLQLLLLAENFTGYSNLCQLVTTRHLEERPVTLEELNQHREGLIALAHVGRGRHPRLKEIFGGSLYLEAHRLWPGDGRQLRETLHLGQQLGVPVAATNDVHFLRPEEHLHHRVLNAVRTGTLLSTVERPEILSAEAYFKSAAEMQHAFPDHPELLRATLDIAERCNLGLPLGATIFPEFPVPQSETPFSYLWKLCFEGVQRRYQPLTPPVLARLTHELEVINKLNLAPYFLLVWDIVEEAKRRGIPAVARGSAASSMVTYCLGVSRVCPLRWGLYFERFLNEQRGDIPDIDLDICGARRDELLDYVYTRWGQSYVAMIASFVTMHARLAIREVAKVFGISPAEVNHFTRRLPHRPVREILAAIRTLPECKSLPAAEEPWKTILDVALRLDDFPRHLGIHPCGTVIAAQPLTRLVPLEVATKGIVVTQYDMHAVEALGLIKMDLLGQRGLTTMSLALKNIEERNSKFEIRNSQLATPAAISNACHPERSEGSALEISNSKSEMPEPVARVFRRGDSPDVTKRGFSHGEKTLSTAFVPAATAEAVAAGDPSAGSPGGGMGNSLGRLPRAKSRGKPWESSGAHAPTSLPQADAEGAGPERHALAQYPRGRIDFDAIPEGDLQACAMIATGRTLGIFQVESPGMRGLLRALRAKTLDDICLALALIRPGAAEYGAKESFLRRLAGREPVRYPHPRTEPILRETLGICVYQEQVMQLAQAAGDFSLAEADLARRAAAKFADRRERECLHSKFLKAAERLGLDGAARDETWHMVEKFAGFGFCKAHAATYADLSYRIAYLKAHYPAEFLAAMCSSGAGFYHVSAYVEEAKRWGIAVRLPSVNHSQCEYTAESLECGSEAPALFTAKGQCEPVVSLRGNASAESSICSDSTTPRFETKAAASLPHSTAMRIGLMQVKGLRAETIAAIVREREEQGAYRSLEDFLARVPVERDEIESLIKCGAFDDVGSSHPCVSTREGTAPALSEVKGSAVLVPQQHKAGALAPEVQHSTRAAQLWRLNLALAHRGAHAQRAAAGESLFPESAQGREADSTSTTAFAATDYTREQRLRYEQEILEVCVSGHPLDRFPRNGEVWSTDILEAAERLQSARSGDRSFRSDKMRKAILLKGALAPEAGPSGAEAQNQITAGMSDLKVQPLRRRALLIGQRVTLLGWVITFRRVGTKNYRNMMFVTCEDQRGIYEVVLFPPAYESYGGLVFETRLLRVTGRVEPGGQINCEKLEPLRLWRQISDRPVGEV